MDKLICFDVDGVLIDSTDEILLMYYNDHQAWLTELELPGGDFATRIDSVPANFLRTATQLYRKSHRLYHRVAANLLILGRIDPEEVTTELIEELSSINTDVVQRCITRVSEGRKRLRESPDFPKLFKGFKEVDYDWIKHQHDAGRLYFLTNNPDSIHCFAHIAFSPNPEQLRTPETGIHSKAEHLLKLAQDTDPAKIMFIDDKPSSLKEAAEDSSLSKANILHNNWDPEGGSSEDFDSVDFAEIVRMFEGM